ncbi:MAG: pitrilysin family protein, partial [Thermodesulfobacteriota bacterium]|nr:pitrilysin family protein [Thermodesulfobacteriota bacterium]
MKPFKKKFEQETRCFLSRIVFSIFVCAAIAASFASDLEAASVSEGCRKFKLDNGFTVLLKEDYNAQVAAIQVWVKTGSANETEEEAGITHLIEHMIFKGTPTRKTGEIAAAIETSGGQINAYTSYDRTVYHVQIPSSSFDTALEVLLDAVQHSLFDPLELEREKEVVMEEYRRSLDSPRTRLSWSMMNLCFEKHPYGRPIIGYDSTIPSFNRADILKYMEKWYTPENMVLVAVGDFEAERASRRIESLIKDFPTRTGQRPTRPVEPVQTSLRNIVLRDDVQQVYLDMSWHIPSVTHEDMPAIDVLEMILGHGRTSRLYGHLKMEENLVHSIGAGAYAMEDPGLFSINATLNPGKLNSVLAAIFEEIARITLEPVNNAELSRAMAMAEADFVFAMEKISGQARTLAYFETMEGDMRKADEYLERLKGVTSGDIMRVARAYCRPENLSIGILAPKAEDITLTGQDLAQLFERASNVLSRESEEASVEGKKAVREVLPNGMTLIIKENHHLPVVSLAGAFLG